MQPLRWVRLVKKNIMPSLVRFQPCLGWGTSWADLHHPWWLLLKKKSVQCHCRNVKHDRLSHSKVKKQLTILSFSYFTSMKTSSWILQSISLSSLFYFSLILSGRKIDCLSFLGTPWSHPHTHNLTWKLPSATIVISAGHWEALLGRLGLETLLEGSSVVVMRHGETPLIHFSSPHLLRSFGSAHWNPTHWTFKYIKKLLNFFNSLQQ